MEKRKKINQRTKMLNINEIHGQFHGKMKENKSKDKNVK